jgi:hypothetical protein
MSNGGFGEKFYDPVHDKNMSEKIKALWFPVMPFYI